MYFSAGSPKDCELLLNNGIKEILVSYYYLKKRKSFFADFLPEFREKGGTFMTDSGGFSFIGWGHSVGDNFTKAAHWIPYLEEYVQWVHDNYKDIYVIANLDMDNIVGREAVDEWNMKYFKPLESLVNVVYVAHFDHTKMYGDPNGMKRVREYLNAYDYVGVNHEMAPISSQVFALAAAKKRRIHGFGWTSIPMLQSQPFFSVDSTTWLGGARYGTTYMHDGKNFRVIDYKRKYLRKTKKNLCKKLGVSFQGLVEDNINSVHPVNIDGWKGARGLYLRAANLKLRTKTIAHYDKRS